MDTKAELEEAWAILRDTIYSGIDADCGRDQPIDNPLKKLGYYLEFGMYPPPEVLISISETYETYIALKGKVDLEESFFGKPQKGKGNFSSRSDKNSDIHMLQLYLAVNSVTDKKSQYDVASDYLERKNSEDDPEHLLRKMRRHRESQKNYRSND